MNNKNWIGIGIIVVVLVAIAYFIGQNSSNQTQTTSSPAANNTNTQSAIQPSQTESQTTQPTSAQIQPTQKSLSDIVKEWSGSTAYLTCDWNDSNDNLIQEVTGSGLLAMLNSTLTVITNKHVVYNPTYGYANRCGINFPGDDGSYIYTSNDYVGYGPTGYFPNYGNLTIDSNGNDVAYISGMHWVHLLSASSPSAQTTTPPSISLSDHSKNASFACSSPENTGDSVLILGYPVYGSKVNEFSSQDEPTATEGIISGKDGIYYTTSAKIDHGNSGGLAIDEASDCYFGIPTWDESGSFESLGRILPSSTFLNY